MEKTETDTKRKAEDEATLVKVAGCPSMSVLGLTAATGWGGVCYVPFATPTHAAAAVERINREVAGAVASVVDEAPPGVDVAAPPSKKPPGRAGLAALQRHPVVLGLEVREGPLPQQGPHRLSPGKDAGAAARARHGRVRDRLSKPEAAAARINGDLPSVVPTAGITADCVRRAVTLV